MIVGDLFAARMKVLRMLMLGKLLIFEMFTAEDAGRTHFSKNEVL